MTNFVSEIVPSTVNVCFQRENAPWLTLAPPCGI